MGNNEERMKRRMRKKAIQNGRNWERNNDQKNRYNKVQERKEIMEVMK